MGERRHHQMPAGIRVEVEDHVAMPPAMDDQRLAVVPVVGLRAEHAFVLLAGGGHVAQAPGRPDPMIGHRRGILVAAGWCPPGPDLNDP